MTKIGDHSHSRIPGMDGKSVKRSERARSGKNVEGASGKTSRNSSVRNVSKLHHDTHLRDTVANLVDSGDLNASSDGRVRQGRVEEARQNTANGAYDDYRILSDVVDRLLSQWEI